MAHLHSNVSHITRDMRNKKNKHLSPVLWFTGLSGAGKSTLANALQYRLFHADIQVTVLDGDDIRSRLCRDLGFSDADRVENIRRVAELAKLFSESGILTIAAFISPTFSVRAMAREIIGTNFTEIFISTSLSVCESRDVHGLYKKARKGEISHFTGIDSPFEEPVSPDLSIDTANREVDDCVDQIMRYLQEKKFL